MTQLSVTQRSPATETVPGGRKAWRALLIQIIATIIVVLLMTSGKVTAQYLFYGFMFASCTGWLAWFVMPLAVKHTQSLRYQMRWLVCVLTLFVVGVVGPIIAELILATMGFTQWRDIFQWLVMALPTAVVVALVIGILWMLYDLLSQRLHSAQREAKLATLEARLQPHFLFNTLNSIAALIPENPKAAEQMTERLASLLRFCLDSDRHATVTLAHELTIATNYLEIEKTRFGDRLSYSIEVPTALRQYSVPPFCLQTLVENCIKHGGSQINITASQQHTLVLEVSDSGTGFELHDIKDRHALANLRERLHLLWGSKAELSISKHQHGVTVRVELPVSTLQQDTQ